MQILVLTWRMRVDDRHFWLVFVDLAAVYAFHYVNDARSFRAAVDDRHRHSAADAATIAIDRWNDIDGVV